MDAQLEVPVAGGSRMLVETGDLIGSVLAVSGVWEPHVTAAFRRLLAAGDVCIDVGANIGYFTLLASRLVGPSGHVYAFEPGSRAYAALRANLDLNGSTNVTAIEAAAGEAEGQALLSPPAPGNLASASLRRSASGSTTVAVQRVDSAVRADDFARVRLVKIDVEGYEMEVLKGLEGLFETRARPAIVVEVSPAADGEGYLAAFCAEHGLEAHHLVDPGLFAAGDWELRLEPRSVTVERHELLLLPADTPLGRGR
jgi:FkbM family methyltransferase